jgi:peptidyl-prolyl cis-trans isomerase C
MSARASIVAIPAGGAILAMLAGWVPAQSVPTRSGKPAAIVNGETISLAEVESVIAALRGGGPEPAEVPEAKRKEMRHLALGFLIDELLFQQALRGGPAVNSKEVDQRMVELIKALAKENKKLEDFCRESGQTVAQLQARLVAQLQWRDYIKDRVTEKDLEKYYAEYKAFFDGDMVHASHIVLRVPANCSAAERQATYDRLAALRQDILAGKIDFATAAKQHSQCPSAPSGGDLGLIPRKWGMVDEAIARAAFFTSVGAVSDVVQSDVGLHLIRVTERKPGKPSDFNQIKEQVREIYLEDLRQALIAQQHKTARVEICME